MLLLLDIFMFSEGELLYMESEKKQIEPKITESIPDGMKPQYSNTVKIAFSEKDFSIDFGQLARVSEEEFHVDVVSRVVIAPDALKEILVGLLRAGIDYDTEYGNKLGFLSDKE